VRRGARAAALAIAATVVAAGVSAPASAAATRTPAAEKPEPARIRGATVFAAASLTEVFQAMAPRERYSFGGSDQLAFQIEQGAPADVFVSANVRYPDELYAKGLVARPHIFTYNNLVVVVPKANPANIASVRDLAKPGVKLVIGDSTVPVGAYTRTVLRRLELNSALRNVVSNEQDVKAVVGKVALNEADAGVVYQTDVRPVKRLVTKIPIPDSAQPVVAYSLAVTRSARNRKAAQDFVRYVLGKEGRAWLRTYGFIVTRPH
jgi:molybdate transport system substrate-binding protein